MSQTSFKTSAKQNRNRGRDAQPPPRPRLNSQPQGATKGIGKKVTENVTKKVTKWESKGDRNRKKWPTPFCVPPFAARWNKHIKLRKIPGTPAGVSWHTRRGETGFYRPVSQGFPVVCSRKIAGREGHFCGTPAGDTRTSRVFSEILCECFLCAFSARLNFVTRTKRDKPKGTNGPKFAFFADFAYGGTWQNENCPEKFTIPKRNVAQKPRKVIWNVPEKVQALFSCLRVFHRHFFTVLQKKNTISNSITVWPEIVTLQ